MTETNNEMVFDAHAFAAPRRVVVALLSFLALTYNVAAYRLEIDDVRVSPLIETRWDQSTWGRKSSAGKVFNLYTPGNSVCGCGVTASAQLMRYHRYPDYAMAQIANDCNYHERSTNYEFEVLHLTTRGGVYEWEKMPLSYDCHPELDLVERDVIARLTSDIGITFGVSYMYRDHETNTDKDSLVKHLKREWGFKSGYFIWPEGVEHGTLIPTWMQQAIFASLNARRPVLAWFHRPETAEKEGDGHTLLLDGYGYHGGKPYLHVNCGWSGKDDGWYALMEDIVSDYSRFRWIGFNIHPYDEGQILSGRITDAAGRAVSQAVVTIVDQQTFAIRHDMTDTNGIYSFVISNAATFRVSVTKDGASVSTNGVEVKMPTIASSQDDTGSKILIRNAATIGNLFDVNLVLDIPDSQRSYEISFDLGECGVHIGGGELEQTVLSGTCPLEPDFSVSNGWHFIGWKPSIAAVTNDMKFVALFQDDAGDLFPACYVNVNADGGGDGRTPQTALSSLLNGMSMVSTGGVVCVAPGTYPSVKYTANKNLTVKSGCGKNVTIIDGGCTNRVVHLGTNYVGCTNTVLKGFTIRNGYREGENVAGSGCYAGTYVDCDIVGNVIYGSGAAAYGAVLKNCLVRGNYASGNGGGVGRCDVVRSKLFCNTALQSGGGAYNSFLTECLVMSNSANWGGGIYGGTAERSRLERNISNRSGGGAHRSVLSNSIIALNSSTNEGTYGGGCYECTNLNCTIYGNSVTASGGGTYNCILTNCIIWGNLASNASYMNSYKGTYSYCLSDTVQGGTGNLVGDPMMNAPSQGDFRLRSGSPCLDSGLTAVAIGMYDVLGHVRIQNGRVDIGACEGDELTTLTTEVEVPYSWLDNYQSLLS